MPCKKETSPKLIEKISSYNVSIAAEAIVHRYKSVSAQTVLLLTIYLESRSLTCRP